MNLSEIGAALGTLSATQAEAVAEVLRAASAEEVGTLAGPDQADGARHYNAGRLAMVEDLRVDWQERILAARREAAE